MSIIRTPGQTCWYIQNGKTFKGYFVGGNEGNTQYLLRVPKLHNKLVTLPWREVIFEAQVAEAGSSMDARANTQANRELAPNPITYTEAALELVHWEVQCSQGQLNQERKVW